MVELPEDFVDVQVVESCWGDWWVVEDGRVTAVHLVSDDYDGEAFSHALEQADEASGKYGFAVYAFGIVPRCCAADYMVGEPGRVYSRNEKGVVVREGLPMSTWCRSDDVPANGRV